MVNIFDINKDGLVNGDDLITVIRETVDEEGNISLKGLVNIFIKLIKMV